MYFEPKADAELQYIVFGGPSAWMACEFEWASPLPQWLSNPACQVSPSVCQAIRASPIAPKIHSESVEPLPVLELAAWRAFWTMDKASLLSLARAVNLSDHVKRDMSLFEVVQQLVQGVLNISEVDLADVCAKRLGSMTPAYEDLYGELLSIDEASGMMDQDDERDMKHEKRNYENRRSVKAEYKEALHKFVRKVRPPQRQLRRRAPVARVAVRAPPGVARAARDPAKPGLSGPHLAGRPTAFPGRGQRARPPRGVCVALAS